MTRAHIYLEHTLKTGQIPSALCIIGSQEDERLALMQWYVAALKSVEIITLGPVKDETTISVAAVRDMLSRVSRSTFGGGLRVVMCPNADILTHGAANAFLKCLEDPPAQSVFLLSARSDKSVLSTIASRCQIIRLSIQPIPPLSDDEKKAYTVWRALLREMLWKRLDAVSDSETGNDVLKRSELFLHYALYEAHADASLIPQLLTMAESIREARTTPSLASSRTLHDRIILSSA